jgi:hypothetical protein
MVSHPKSDTGTFSDANKRWIRELNTHLINKYPWKTVKPEKKKPIALRGNSTFYYRNIVHPFEKF